MTPSIRTLHALGLAAGLVFCIGLAMYPVARHGWNTAMHAAGLRENNCVTAPSGLPPTDHKQIVEGTENDDVLTGSAGDDWMFGYKGNDLLRGGAGHDRIDGSLGDDTLEGGPGNDILYGCEGNDVIRGGDGDDTIDAGDDDDFVEGDAGNDVIDGGDGNDVLRGGGGSDVISGGDGSDLLEGGAGNDRLSGDDGSDVLRGGAGDDVLLGGDGDDDLDGESGDDWLDGGRGNDTLRGGLGNDTLLGNAGNDTLDGGDGHDVLYGGDGIDSISGGFGDDLIVGGAGADVLAGNDGNDIFLLRAGDVPAGEAEAINGGNGVDVLILTGFVKVPGMPAPGSVAEWQLVDPLTGAIYRIVNVERVEFSQVLAQAQERGDRAVSLLLVNASNAAASGRVLFFGPDGAIVPALVSGSPAPREELTFAVPALGSLRLSTRVPGPVTAQVFAAAPLGVSVRSDPAAPGASSLNETPLVDSAIVPVTENRVAGIGSGVLVVNSLAQSRVKFTLHAMDGRELDTGTFVGSKEVDVPAYGHAVHYVRDLFPRLPADFRGTMTIQGGIDRPQEGGPIAVVALERGPGGRVASSPAVPMSPLVRAEPVQIAGLTADGDTTSSLVLINPSPSVAAQGTVRFFDEAGNPWSVSVNRQPPAPAMSYELDSRASTVFAISATGTVQHGSARAETGKGVVSALLRVGSGGAVTHVPASQVFSSFMAAVQHDRTTGLTTRLSVSSTGSALVLQLKLRNAAGVDVPGGATEIRLAANGETSRTLTQLFPAAAADAFDGTLTVTVTGGTVAVTALLVEGTTTTPLPLVALQ